ncbi:MAG: hypothetical protein H0V76_08370 [Blastocatellia bacterium]|nr:hypothetical protein [Blastocatellia bacterium]
MIGKKIVGIFLTAAFVMAGGISVLAQGQAVQGVVRVKKADGTESPAAGVTVEAYRTDTGRGSLPAAITNDKGEFSWASFPSGHVYALSVSGPGVGPRIQPNVKGGMTQLVIIVDEGAGEKLTEAEVREVASLAGLSEAELKALQAKQQVEIEKYNAEKARIEDTAKVVNAALQAGNAAFNSKPPQYEVAIAKYDEGIAAQPDFAGSAPVLLNNRGLAFQRRAVENYNAAAKNTDATARLAAMATVRKDFADAMDSFHRSYTILQTSESVKTVSDPKMIEGERARALSIAVETIGYMAQVQQVDESVLDKANELTEAYLSSGADRAAKERAMVAIGDVHRSAGDMDRAVAAYRKALETAPKNVDAMAGIGLSLVNSGYESDSREQLQEGSNYLNQFINSAPDNHKFKSDAKELVEAIKASHKINPQPVRRN